MISSDSKKPRSERGNYFNSLHGGGPAEPAPKTPETTPDAPVQISPKDQRDQGSKMNGPA